MQPHLPQHTRCPSPAPGITHPRRRFIERRRARLRRALRRRQARRRLLGRRFERRDAGSQVHRGALLLQAQRLGTLFPCACLHMVVVCGCV